MDIGDVLIEIELNSNRRERIICLSEVIIHLKTTRRMIGFINEAEDWKNIINQGIIKDSQANIDKLITRVTELLDSNIDE